MHKQFLQMLLCLTGLAFGQNAFAQQPEYIVLEHDINQVEDLPQRIRIGNDLFVQDGGEQYLVQTDGLLDWPIKEVIAVDDLDGDGWNDAIIASHSGGASCCGTKYWLVSKREDQFFTVHTHEDFYGDSLEVITRDGERTLSVTVSGCNQAVSLSLFRFEDGVLQHLSTSQNAGLRPALLEVNAFELEQDRKPVSRSVDLDDDQTLDSLDCSYWERWGTLMCEVQSSVHGSVKTGLGCDRIGVLTSSTNGLNDLVCNRFTVLRFDGDEYNQIN